MWGASGLWTIASNKPHYYYYYYIHLYCHFSAVAQYEMKLEATEAELQAAMELNAHVTEAAEKKCFEELEDLREKIEAQDEEVKQLRKTIAGQKEQISELQLRASGLSEEEIEKLTEERNK